MPPAISCKADFHTSRRQPPARPKNMPDDFRVSITNAPGKNAYPISTFTWLLIPDKIENSYKRKTIKEFLHWMLTAGPERCDRAGLCAASRTGGRKGNRTDRFDTVRIHHGNRCHRARASTTAQFRQAAAQRRPDCASGDVHVRGQRVPGYRAAGVRTLDSFGCLARQVRFGLPVLQHLGPGGGKVRRVAVHLRNGADLVSGAAHFCSAGRGRGHLSGRTGSARGCPTSAPSWWNCWPRFRA